MGKYYRNEKPNKALCLNSFKLDGLEKIEVGYRLIDVSGLLEDDDDYEKNIRQLAIIISGQIKMPVEPVRINKHSYLAVTGLTAQLQKMEIKVSYTLTPDEVFTTLGDEIHHFKFCAVADRTEFKLARRALEWAIDNALKSSATGWWRYGRRFVSRYPLESTAHEAIQAHPAFYYAFMPSATGGFELNITPSVCYIECQSVYEKYGQNIPANIKGKRYLYKNGLEFYDINAVGVGKPAGQDMMLDPDGEGSISVQQRLINRWKGKKLQSINELDPSALTIAYKTGSQKSRRAHSQLLFELVGAKSSDDGFSAPHNEAIMNPDRRGRITEQIISDIAPFLELFGTKLRPSVSMRRLGGEVRRFAAPKILLGDDEEMTTDLAHLGIDRFRALKQIGPANPTNFSGEEYFIFDSAMPDEVQRDFKKRLNAAIRDLYGRVPNFQNIPVDNRRSRFVRNQYNKFVEAVGDRHGYGLVILSEEKKAGEMKKLHDSLKRHFWTQLQTQCASLEKILSFYKSDRSHFGEVNWRVRENKIGLYNSYLKYVALGFLLVNRKWLWKLAKGSLQNDVHVGIDVYHDLAIFTFIYGDAELITFHMCKSKKGEKLSSGLIQEALYDNLSRDLRALGIMPSSIVFHRDGRIFRSELRGIKNALNDLSDENLLSEDYRYAVVEIHKTSSSRPRLYRRTDNRFENPEMGTFVRLDNYEGILATTGAPLLNRGTAQPLAIEKIIGDIDIDDIAHDMYALSHLSFASPASAMSLPFTIALADQILRESSPGTAPDLWEEEEVEEYEEVDNRFRYQQSNNRGGVKAA